MQRFNFSFSLLGIKEIGKTTTEGKEIVQYFNNNYKGGTFMPPNEITISENKYVIDYYRKKYVGQPDCEFSYVKDYKT